MGAAKKQDLLSKKQNNTKQWTLLKARSVKQKARTIQNNL